MRTLLAGHRFCPRSSSGHTMASMSLMLAKSNFVVQAGRERKSFVTEIRSSNPVEEWRLLPMPAGRGGRREGVVVRAGLGAFSSAVQRRRSRKGGRRRKKRQGSQTQDVDPHSISNEDGLGKLPDNNNGTSLRDAHDDDAEHIYNSDNETEESRLDHIHSDGTELSQHDQGKESEGSILQELEEKVIPVQQSAGSNLNSIRLDAIQRMQGKLPDNNNGTSLRDAHDDDAEHIYNSDNETEESRLDHIHSDGTELSQHDQGKESEGSMLQELEEKVIPVQQSAGINLNSIRLDAIQRESHSQFVENLTVSATMQQFLGTTNLSKLQQTTMSSGMVQEQSSGLILAETSEILDPHVFIHSVNAATWYSSIQQVENHPQTMTGQLLADQSPSSNGSTGYKSDSEEVGDQVTLGAASSEKVPMRKTKGDDVKMDQLMVRKTSSQAEQPADVEVLLDISVVDAKAPEPEVFENRGQCMEASTAGVNHSNGHTKPNSSLGKVDKSGLARNSGLLEHARPKQTNECTSLQPSVLQTVQDNMRGVDTTDVGVLAEDAKVSCTMSDDLSANSSLSTSLFLKVATVLPKQVLEELPSKLTELPVKLMKEFPAKVAELQLRVVKELPAKVAELPVIVKDLPPAVVEDTPQVEVIEPVVETLADVVVEQVGQLVEQVGATGTLASELETLNVSQVTESVTLPVAEVTDSVTSTVSNVQDTVKSTVADATDSVTTTAAEFAESETSATVQVLESVSPAADQVSSTASWQTHNDFTNSAGNLPSFLTSDAPEFRGLQGIQNVHILQEDLGLLATIYDFYIFMLKRPLPQFALGMFAAPILLSVLFTGLYLLDFQGLSLDETARGVLESAPGDDISGVLTMPWTLFRLFMFSLSLSTGLQPELVPVSPYTLVVANINALFAQLLFVFLSGAVFARLSQPSHPVRSSKVALMCPAFTQPKESGDASAKIVLMARFVLVGPQPCELVDVKVDLTYKYNTVTRTGSFFRARRSLKLVRSEIAHLTYGMLVRHIIDETSPLYNRTLEMLRREDAVFTLSVIGLERTSMQCVFHLQHYCVSDADVIWDAEFEDMVLINPKKERIYDHSKLSWWRAV